MKNSIRIILLSILFSGCHTDDNSNGERNSCIFEDPITELSWLQEITDEINSDISSDSEYKYIEQASYREETVFIEFHCNPFANSIFPVFNCEGKVLGTIGKGDDSAFIDPDFLDSRKVIWQSKNFKCTFNNS